MERFQPLEEEHPLSPLAAQMHLGPHRICTMNRERERGSFSPDPEFCAKHDPPTTLAQSLAVTCPKNAPKNHVNLAELVSLVSGRTWATSGNRVTSGVSLT